VFLPLENLGLTAELEKRFTRLIHMPERGREVKTLVKVPIAEYCGVNEGSRIMTVAESWNGHAVSFVMILPTMILLRRFAT
jgi:hypothetical protein